MPRRMPKRGPGGKFLRSDASRSEEKGGPAGGSHIAVMTNSVALGIGVEPDASPRRTEEMICNTIVDNTADSKMLNHESESQGSKIIGRLAGKEGPVVGRVNALGIGESARQALAQRGGSTVDKGTVLTERRGKDTTVHAQREKEEERPDGIPPGKEESGTGGIGDGASHPLAMSCEWRVDNANAQQTKERERPAGPITHPGPERHCEEPMIGKVARESCRAPLDVGGAFIKGPSAQNAPDVARQPRKCEECGTELDEMRVMIRGHVLYIFHCPRCTPDPMQVLTE